MRPMRCGTKSGGKVISLLLAIAMAATMTLADLMPTSAAAKAITALEYRVTGGQIVPYAEGEPWLITDGHMSWQLFDVFPHAGHEPRTGKQIRSG